MKYTQEDFVEAKIFYEKHKDKKAFKLIIASEIAKAIINLEIAKLKRYQNKP